MLGEPPHPEGGAVGKCAVGLLRGLQAHGVEVRALAARQSFSVPGDPPPDVPVEVVPVEPETPGWRARVRRVRRPNGHLSQGEFAAQVRAAAHEADVVHLEESATGWCDVGISTPSLVHLHYLVRRDRDLGMPWERRFRHVLEFRMGERAALRRHRYLVASSPLVADALRAESPRAEVVHVPLSLDPRYYAPAPLNGPPTVGIIGTAMWEPTARAMRRLAETVWPQIHARAPDARLLVAGRGSGSLGLQGAPGIDLLGEVESAGAFFQRISALVYPLDRGSGMKVKVLEAIASGVPVVTTPAGAEGIQAEGGIVVESDDHALAAAAAELLTNGRLRQEAGRSARAAFDRRYTPEPATRPLVELYARIAGTG